MVVFPVSNHFNFSKVSGNRKNNQIPWKNDYCQGILSFLLFIDTFWIQKCLETEKRPNPLKKSLFSRDFVISPVSRHFLNSKVSRNWKTTKSLENNVSRQYWICKVSRNRRNDQIPWIQKVSRNRRNEKIPSIHKVSRNRTKSEFVSEIYALMVLVNWLLMLTMAVQQIAMVFPCSALIAPKSLNGHLGPVWRMVDHHYRHIFWEQWEKWKLPKTLWTQVKQGWSL